MNPLTNDTKEPVAPTPSNGPTGAIIAGGVVAMLLTAGNGFLLWKTNEMNTHLQRLQTTVDTELPRLKQTTTAMASNAQQSIEDLQIQLQNAKSEASKAANSANLTARRQAQRLVAQFAAEQKKAQEQQQESVATALGEIRQATTDAHSRVAGVVSDVNTVKTEVGQAKTEISQTRSELANTILDLKSVRGDLGIQSGLIATNSKEIAALRELGDKNYYEFDLRKTNTPQKVGSVAVLLKKADPKRNRYTIELVADDRKVEKKDKSINEPVQFYMQRSRLPYEIVVNEVANNRIVGYLATPKAVLQAAAR